MCLSLQTEATPGEEVSSRRRRLAQDSKRLLAVSQRQMRVTSGNLASRSSLGQTPGSRSNFNSGRSLQLSEANVESGMVLPFEPMTMTFSDLHYYVPLPAVRVLSA